MATLLCNLRKSGWIARCCLAVAGLLCLAIGCANPKQRYEVLSIFFDGVPNPDAVAEAARRNAAGSTSSVTVLIQHKPYADQNCSACHPGDRSAFFTAAAAKAPGNETCLTCHKDVPQQYENMHGPVAVNACNFCHNAHASRYPHLLRGEPHKICMQCHDTGLSLEVAEHRQAAANCLDCHSGHGGSRHLLKPSILAITPPDPGTKTPAEGGAR